MHHRNDLKVLLHQLQSSQDAELDDIIGQYLYRKKKYKHLECGWEDDTSRSFIPGTNGDEASLLGQWYP